MRIDIGNMVVGGVAGGIDEALLYLDESQGRTEPFRTVTDWGRIGLTALGYLGQAFNFFPVMAAALAQSELPLATKSIVKAVRLSLTPATVTPAPSSRAMYSQPRVASSPGGRVSSRWPAPRNEAEFANVRLD